MNTTTHRADSIMGCLLGTAAGDSLGLPWEGVSPKRQSKLAPPELGQCLFFGKGMISDDTEHTCFVAQSLLASGGEPELFAKDLAWRLRFWLLGLPAGVGFATLRAIIKLWLGFNPANSGVFSAGNGPAMRSALLGVLYGHEPEKLATLVRLSTRLTHTDPKAEYGALAVAWAAYWARCHPQEQIIPQSYLELLRQQLPTQATELLSLCEAVVASVEARQTTQEFAQKMGWDKGIGGYIYDTVPAALHAWLSHPKDFHQAILGIIRCGGDTDTTAAIVGGIVGAAVGESGIPRQWLDDLIEWPCSVRWIKALGQDLATSLLTPKLSKPRRLCWAAIVLRNLFFLAVVLSHGLRRLLPPY